MANNRAAWAGVVATLVAAIVGAWATLSAGPSQPDPTPPPPEQSTTRTATRAPAAPSASESSAPSPAGTIRNQGSATVARQSGIDLDSQEANWGAGVHSSVNDLFIESRGPATIRMSGQRSRYAPVDAGSPIELATCENATTYGSPSGIKAPTEPGSKFCVLTNGNRYSLVTLTGTEVEGEIINYASFDITTWD